MADHEDYLPGEAPAAHKTTHQDGGADEVNIEGLTGITSYMAAHILLPTVHQDAPALITTHAAIDDAHHVRYTDAEAETQADAKIAIHTALPTVHQDAPALILTHKGDASAHHARYTDGEAEAQADAKIAIHAALPTVHQDAPALILTHKGEPAAHHIMLKGTWTPQLTFGGNHVDMEGTFTGNYVRIGDMIFLTCAIVLTSKGSSVGAAYITGAPVAVTSMAATPYLYNVSFADFPIVYGSAGVIYLFETTNAGVRSQIGNADFSDDSQLSFNGFYIV